jgi:hypothetical protein
LAILHSHVPKSPCSGGILRSSNPVRQGGGDGILEHIRGVYPPPLRRWLAFIVNETQLLRRSKSWRCAADRGTHRPLQNAWCVNSIDSGVHFLMWDSGQLKEDALSKRGIVGSRGNETRGRSWRSWMLDMGGLGLGSFQAFILEPPKAEMWRTLARRTPLEFLLTVSQNNKLHSTIKRRMELLSSI